MSIDASSAGLEIGVAISAVPAVTAIMGEDGVAGGGLGLVGAEVHFLDFFIAGRCGQECES